MKACEIAGALFVIGLLACGGSRRVPVAPVPVAAADAGQEELFVAACGPYEMMVLFAPAHGTSVEQHAATAAAREEFERAAKASGAHDYLGAAHHYLACAERLRGIPAGHDQEQTAIRNGQVCYYNAIHSYATAGRFEAEGRVAISAAAERDSRMASYIEEQLKAPPADCESTPPD